MHLSVVQWLPIIATLVLQLLILTVMVRRKSSSAFPLFFGYVAFALGTFLVQAVLTPHIGQTKYFYMSWIILGIQTLLSFTVIYEVFVHILKPYSALVDLGKLLFRWAILFLALASGLTALATNGSEANKICAAILLLARSSELMQCGFLLLFVLFESRLGLSWRSPAVCIMLGFGGNSALSLAGSFVQDHFPNWSSGVEWASIIACVLVYAGWYASFALPQPARLTAQDSPTKLILQRWNEALMTTPLVARKHQVAFAPIESFLPGVERTVEQVMARKMTH